jgi:hypothetical protein
VGRIDVSRHGLLPVALASLVLAGCGQGDQPHKAEAASVHTQPAPPALTKRDLLELNAAFAKYWKPNGFAILRPSVSLALNRTGAVAPTDNTQCVTAQYKTNFAVEHPSIGYATWIKWAEKNGIVEEQTVGTLNGAPWRCPFVVEQQVLTDYRMMWDGKPGLTIWFAIDPTMNLVGLKQSYSTVSGVPKVPTFDLVFDLSATSQWPGVTFRPNPVHSTVRFARNPKTGKIEFVKADLHMPTIKLDE